MNSHVDRCRCVVLTFVFLFVICNVMSAFAQADKGNIRVFYDSCVSVSRIYDKKIDSVLAVNKMTKKNLSKEDLLHIKLVRRLEEEKCSVRQTYVTKGLALAFKCEELSWVEKFSNFAKEDSLCCDELYVTNADNLTKALRWAYRAVSKTDMDDIVAAFRNLDCVCQLCECRDIADGFIMEHLIHIGKTRSPYTFCYITAGLVEYYGDNGGGERASRLFKFLMKHTDEGLLPESRRVAILNMGARNDYVAAAKLYVGGLKEQKALDDKSFILHSDTQTVIGIAIATIIIAFIVVVAFGLRRDKKNDKLNNIISRMTTEADELERKIEEFEHSGNQTSKEIEALRKKVEQLRKDAFDRIGVGRRMYESLEKGLPMPNDISNADACLADFYSVFHSENYNRFVNEYSDLSPRLITYLILTEMGCDDVKIKGILCISQTAIRSIRYRLNAKKK